MQVASKAVIGIAKLILTACLLIGHLGVQLTLLKKNGKKVLKHIIRNTI
jgi:hypothetical protein